jgi:hypothetical protein
MVSTSYCATTAPVHENMIADVDPIPAGTVDAGVKRFFTSRLKNTPLTATFIPRDNTVYLQFMYETVTYRQYWDAPARQRFITAVTQYKADFDAKNLNGRSSQSRKAYGSFKSKTEWGQFKFMVNSTGYPRVELGYIFNNNSPYFIITQRSAQNIKRENDTPNGSLFIELFFTRAMADDLVNLFNQQYLVSLLSPQMREQEQKATPDVYGEDVQE